MEENGKHTLTDSDIRNLVSMDKTRDYPAYKEAGFGIRVYPSGAKTFFFQYKIDGQRRFMTLGNYPMMKLKEARELYQAELAKVKALRRGSADGSDPVVEKKRKKEQRIADDAARSTQLTIAELIDEYIEKHAKPNKRGWAEDKRILEHDALKVWGKRKAADIKKRDVVLLLEEIVKRGSPGSANNNFKIIRKMFRFAVQRDILQHTPCEGVVMPAPLVTKDRALSEAEIKTFWNALDTCHASDEIKRVLKLILVTAQRPGEVVGMHTNEIDGHWWTIPSERTKNKRAHRVYLTDTAIDLIGPLMVADPKTEEMKPKGFIFPSPRSAEATKSKALKPIETSAIAHVIRRNHASPVLVNGEPAFDKKGKPITENKLGVDFFTPHDLRRTANTLMASVKIIKEYRERVLNHTLEKLDGTYNQHDYDDEKQMALKALERKILSVLQGTESNVIPINRKTAA